MTIEIVHDVLSSEFEFDVKTIVFETHFQKDLALDSVMFLSLVLEIESRMGTKLPDNKIGEVVTVGDLCKLLEGTS